ncbi:MAG: TonB-dependent receptor plug domain-containing protein [Treponema sp.]|jgi:hypothetical protein|nr:TonB-dependent receptor plug domain-containing protein [Treponema sp.]
MKKSFVIIFLLLTFSVYSRDITVTVKDVDLDLPLEGAVIRMEGNEYICDINGKAVIKAPDGRQVLIQAAYPGYETGRIVIPVTGDEFFIGLNLSGVLQGRELVIETSKPGSSETRTGRSIAVSAKDIAQTAEIGIVEDVMSTIKLLPGVSYTGVFGAQPSIRGGHPGDMSASLDGYYINNPYHWGGGFSIFDPRMVQSAQLSHGVFSTRYGHTISGLLEITSKKPSPTETQFELGMNTSAANINLSIPLFGKGGVLLMGRITYYDPVIWTAKQLAKAFPSLDSVNYIRQAPYIRAGIVNGNYRFTDKLELTATGFWGMDGTGVSYLNSNRTDALNTDTALDFDYTNYQGFLTSSLAWNPRADMLLKFTAGTGYEDAIINGKMTYNIHNKKFSKEFMDKYPFSRVSDSYQYNIENTVHQSDFIFNVQGRIDYDWEITQNLLISTGLQEMFNEYRSSGDSQISNDNIRFAYLGNKEQSALKSFFPLIPAVVWDDIRIASNIPYSPDLQNSIFTSSGYVLTEFNTFDNRLNTELGLRIDHFILQGKGFTAYSSLALNPRLNLDYNIFKNHDLIKSFDISAGTGLFSSINDAVFSAEEKYNIDYIKPNRSWTSIIGVRLEFPESLSLNIEGYYKYVFDRMYIPVGFGLEEMEVKPNFDGVGRIFGVDIMLQKIQSRFWDGWLAYSWNWTKYRDPQGQSGSMGMSGGNNGNDWYFPSFHRYHYLNLVMNIKPVQKINIYVRLGIASGILLSRRIGDGPESYPVLIYNKDNPAESYFIEKYRWPSVVDQTNRTTPSLPMDIKFSIFGGNKNGKTRYEIYIAVENVLSLIYTPQRNTSFNQYTGQIDTGSNTARYDIPIPIPSFGFKYSY